MSVVRSNIAMNLTHRALTIINSHTAYFPVKRKIRLHTPLITLGLRPWNLEQTLLVMNHLVIRTTPI